MNSKNIIEVTETNFEYEVVAYSQNTAVIVDFWAEWCQPCKMLAATLERILAESAGRLRLARVNVDGNPNLAAQFGVRSLPTLKAFSGGQVVGELVGNQPETRVREFIAQVLPPSPLALKVEQADGLLRSRNWTEAEQISRGIIASAPDSTAGMLDLAIALLGQGEAKEAHELLENFPASREFPRAQLLLPYAQVLHEYDLNSLAGNSDLDLAFSNCIHLAKQGKFEPALDGLLDILRQDKRYAQGRVQKVILSLLEIIAGDTETRAVIAPN